MRTLWRKLVMNLNFLGPNYKKLRSIKQNRISWQTIPSWNTLIMNLPSWRIHQPPSSSPLSPATLSVLCLSRGRRGAAPGGGSPTLCLHNRMWNTDKGMWKYRQRIVEVRQLANWIWGNFAGTPTPGAFIWNVEIRQSFVTHRRYLCLYLGLQEAICPEWYFPVKKV